MAHNINDCWRTPKWLYDELNTLYGPFDIDLCATRENSKCEHLCWDFLNSLTGSINSNCIGTIYDDVETGIISNGFMNPPYSNAKPFIEKAWEHSKLMKIVCLIKCDPSTSMWQIFYDFQTGKPKPGCDIKLINKRIQFDPPPEMGAILIKGRWHINCVSCINGKVKTFSNQLNRVIEGTANCYRCGGTGKTKLSGPSFPSCILIFDRRNEND